MLEEPPEYCFREPVPSFGEHTMIRQLLIEAVTKVPTIGKVCLNLLLS